MKISAISERRYLAFLSVSLVGLLLSGCNVTVESRVKSNGTVIRNISVKVPTDDFDMVRREAGKYLREGWKFSDREQVGKKELIATRKFRANDPDVIEAVTFKCDRGWLIPVSRISYKEEISYGDIITTEERQLLAEHTPVTYILSLPGRIDPNKAPNAVKVQDSTAMWKANLNENITISATSLAVRWVWGFIELIILGVLVWAIMPVVNWVNDTSERMSEKRKTARVEKTRKREQAAEAKAQKQAASEATRQQQEAERRQRLDEKKRVEEAARQKKAAQEAARQQKDADRQRAIEEAERKKEEARRAKEEKRKPKSE